MPDEAFNCRKTQVGLLLILPPFIEVCYCVYTIKNFTSVKLKQNQGKHLSWKHWPSQLYKILITDERIMTGSWYSVVLPLANHNKYNKVVNQTKNETKKRNWSEGRENALVFVGLVVSK